MILGSVVIVRRTKFGFSAFYGPVAGMCVCDETGDQLPRGGGHFLDCRFEGGVVRIGWNRESAELTNELQRSIADFQLGGGRLEVEKGFDIAAHGGCWEVDLGFKFLKQLVQLGQMQVNGIPNDAGIRAKVAVK